MIEYQRISTPYGACVLAERIYRGKSGPERKIVFLEFLEEGGLAPVIERLQKKYKNEEYVDISDKKRYPSSRRFTFEELLEMTGTGWDALEVEGTEFQKKVWRTLFEVPYGEIISYSQLAVKAGYEKAVRAVASVVASNPISLIIPCHRIVRNEVFSSPKGKMIKDYGNYRWGREVKRSLIEREKGRK